MPGGAPAPLARDGAPVPPSGIAIFDGTRELCCCPWEVPAPPSPAAPRPPVALFQSLLDAAARFSTKQPPNDALLVPPAFWYIYRERRRAIRSDAGLSAWQRMVQAGTLPATLSLDTACSHFAAAALATATLAVAACAAAPPGPLLPDDDDTPLLVSPMSATPQQPPQLSPLSSLTGSPPPSQPASPTPPTAPPDLFDHHPQAAQPAAPCTAPHPTVPLELGACLQNAPDVCEDYHAEEWRAALCEARRDRLRPCAPSAQVSLSLLVGEMRAHAETKHRLHTLHDDLSEARGASLTLAEDNGALTSELRHAEQQCASLRRSLHTALAALFPAGRTALEGGDADEAAERADEAEAEGRRCRAASAACCAALCIACSSSGAGGLAQAVRLPPAVLKGCGGVAGGGGGGGAFTLLVQRTQELQSADLLNSDLYVEVSGGGGCAEGAARATSVRHMTLRPVWGDSFAFDVPCDILLCVKSRGFRARREDCLLGAGVLPADAYGGAEGVLQHTVLLTGDPHLLRGKGARKVGGSGGDTVSVGALVVCTVPPTGGGVEAAPACVAADRRDVMAAVSCLAPHIDSDVASDLAVLL